MSGFLDTVRSEFNAMRARTFAGDYSGVTHAGLAVVARDTNLVLMAQRAYDETDDPEVRETWEWPGGGLEDGEDPLAAAMREFSEEIGLALPEGVVVNGWRSGPQDNYQGFVYAIDTAMDLGGFTPNDEVSHVSWFNEAEFHTLRTSLAIRPEMRDFDWTLLDVSGNEDDMTPDSAETTPAPNDTEPEWDILAALENEIPVHGVLAPEEIETGDGRGFAAGSMTRRPLRLTFAWQKTAIGGHNGSIVVGSVDRLMRRDGLIHWEGSLMPSAETEEFIDLMAFFGKYGVSVDGDAGRLDEERSKAEGVMWFDAVRAAGLTAVSIPAFHEAYVAFGHHPEMPDEDDESTIVASGIAPTDIIGGRMTFDRGPGWVTNPKETKTIHDYWTKKGEPGYAKVGWGTPGDFRRARVLIGEKIAKNSPSKMKYLNQIIAQWHFDALGYWPGELDKPGNKTSAQAKAERAAKKTVTSLDPTPDKGAWEAVLTSSAGARVLPPASYFERHPDSGPLVITEPDEFGIRRTYGYAGEWGVCHIGYDGKCVEVPEDRTGSDYAEYHLGYTRTSDAGSLPTGLITYKVEHRDAATLLSETAEQAHYDNIEHAWAAVRLGEDDRGVWFSGVVLPHVPEEDIVLIEASGQLSGEWKYGALRGLQCVNIPGFPVMRSSAAYDDQGNVLALVASAIGTTDCAPSPAERVAANRAVFNEEARVRFAQQRANWAQREKVA